MGPPPPKARGEPPWSPDPGSPASAEVAEDFSPQLAQQDPDSGDTSELHDRNTEQPRETVRQAPGPNATARENEVDDDKFNELVRTFHEAETSRPTDWQADIQMLFTAIFNNQLFDTTKMVAKAANLPQLSKPEAAALYEAIRLAPANGIHAYRNWRMLVIDCCRAIQRSSWPMERIIESRIARGVQNISTGDSPWGSGHRGSGLSHSQPRAEATPAEFLFDAVVYTEDDVARMRALCATAYDFPAEMRKATELETKVILGMAQGTIVSNQLPQFTKRIFSSDQRARLRNTIRVQVEGELVLTLPDELPVYPDNQTTYRLIDAVVVAAGPRLATNTALTDMLKEIKTVSYNAAGHAIHFFFNTRQQANRYEGMPVPFRNRLIKLVNAHGSKEDDNATVDVRKRQRTPDGIPNRPVRQQYKLRLLNVSRFVDTIALPHYFRRQTEVPFELDELDSGGPRSRDSLVCGLTFHLPGCPDFLKNKPKIDWYGTPIILQHLVNGKKPPCFACGGAGHEARKCPTSQTQQLRRTIKVGESDRAIKVGISWTFLSENDLEKALRGLSADPPTPPARPLERAVGQEAQPPGREEVAEELEPARQPASTTPHRAAREAPIARAPRKAKAPLAQAPSANAPTGIMQRGQRLRSDTTPAERPEQRTLVLDDSSEEEGVTTNAPKTAGGTKRPSQSVKFTPLIPEPNVMRWVNRLSKSRKALAFNPLTDKIADDEWEVAADAKTEREYPADLQSVLAMTGLHIAHSPASGNCQYAAVGINLIQRSLTEDTAAQCATVVQALKTGIEAAAFRNFERHFTKGTWKHSLESLGRWIPNLTEVEQVQADRHYFSDVARSGAEVTDALPRTHWGNTDTLRMMCYLLQAPVFVLEDQSGNERRLAFTILKPADVEDQVGRFPSAKQYLVTGKEWINEVKRVSRAARDRGSRPPVAVLFRQHHYDALLSRTARNSQQDARPDASTTDPFVSQSEEHNSPDGHEDDPMNGNPFSEDESKEEEQVVTSTPADQDEDTLWDPSLFLGETQELWNQQAQPLVPHEPQRQIADIIRHEGQCKQEPIASMELEPELLDIQSLEALTSLDFDNGPEVQGWMQQHDISEPVLRQWQRRAKKLLAEAASQGTESDRHEPMQQDGTDPSQDQVDSNLGEPEVEPPSLRPSARTPMATRMSDRLKETAEWRAFWDKQEPVWTATAEMEFPTVAAPLQHWVQAVRAEPVLALDLIRRHPSPAFLLSHLSEAVVVAWTEKWRALHASYAQEQLLLSTTTSEVLSHIEHGIDVVQAAGSTDRRKLLKHHWTKWRALKYGGSATLALCDPTKAGNGGRQVLLALIYAEHIKQQCSTVAAGAGAVDAAIVNHMVLRKEHAGYAKCVSSMLRDQNWVIIELFFSALTGHEGEENQLDDDSQ